MLVPKPRAQALLQHLDLLIEKHESRETPDLELLQDLRAHRAALQDATRRRPGDIAKDALRVATWVKFVYDHWPDL